MAISRRPIVPLQSSLPMMITVWSSWLERILLDRAL